MFDKNELVDCLKDIESNLSSLYLSDSESNIDELDLHSSDTESSDSEDNFVSLTLWCASKLPHDPFPFIAKLDLK